MNKQREKRQRGKNVFFYLILVSMLVFSFKLYYERENASVSAGSFGEKNNVRNVSFSDLVRRISDGGCFENE